MLIFILDVSHGHFTSNHVEFARRSQGELRVFLSLFPVQNVLWHKNIIHFILFCVLARHDNRKYHMQLPAKMQRLTCDFEGGFLYEI